MSSVDVSSLVRDTEWQDIAHVVLSRVRVRVGSTVVSASDAWTALLHELDDQPGTILCVFQSNAVCELWKLISNVTRRRIVLVNCMLDESAIGPAFMRRLSRMKHTVQSIWSTQMPDFLAERPCVPVHFLPIGICSIRPFWSSIPGTAAGARSALLYVNMTVQYPCKTAPVCREREYVSHALAQNGFYQRERVTQASMLVHMAECAFVACPRGIGPDTHRCWEALAAGCAIVLTDWNVLRYSARGLLPAVYVMESSAFVVPACPYVKAPLEQHSLLIDDCGDVYLPHWSDVKEQTLHLAHRFVGWKRGSSAVRRFLSSSYWMARLLCA
jgi:hypothetical protein